MVILSPIENASLRFDFFPSDLLFGPVEPGLNNLADRMVGAAVVVHQVSLHTVTLQALREDQRRGSGARRNCR